MSCCLMKSSLVIASPTLILAHHIALCLSYICLTVYPKSNWVQMWSLWHLGGKKKWLCNGIKVMFAMCKLTIDPCMRLMVEDYFYHSGRVYNCLIENWIKQLCLMDRWWFGSDLGLHEYLPTHIHMHIYKMWNQFRTYSLVQYEV